MTEQNSRTELTTETSTGLKGLEQMDWLPGQVSSYLKTPRLQELCAEMQEPIPELIALTP
jgi:hypothetical protein